MIQSSLTDHPSDFVPERIEHADLPADILVAYRPCKAAGFHREGDVDLLQNMTGAMLIKKMAHTFLQVPDIEVFTQKNEKPKAFVEGKEISVSFSHTVTGISAAISTTFNVGCDMEFAGRRVHSKLAGRIKQKDEEKRLYQNLELVQIWTLKEAALKRIGTGLRIPMNSVRIEQESPSLFHVEFHDGKRAKICSFQYQEHWISICY